MRALLVVMVVSITAHAFASSVSNIALQVQERVITQMIGKRVLFRLDGLVWSGEIRQVILPDIGTGEGGGEDYLQTKIEVGLLTLNDPERNKIVTSDVTQTLSTDNILNMDGKYSEGSYGGYVEFTYERTKYNYGDYKGFGDIHREHSPGWNKIMRVLSYYELGGRDEGFFEAIVEVLEMPSEEPSHIGYRQRIDPVLVLLPVSSVERPAQQDYIASEADYVPRFR